MKRESHTGPVTFLRRNLPVLNYLLMVGTFQLPFFILFQNDHEKKKKFLFITKVSVPKGPWVVYMFFV